MVYENYDLYKNDTISFYTDEVDTILENAPASYGILFPWFTETLGVIVFFLLTYWDCIRIPHAAIMFVLGTIMGIGASLRVAHNDSNDSNDTTIDPLTTSILQWTSINSDVLLLVFLPGLIFRDAIEVNFQMFQTALIQILIMAYPMVLMGTAMTATVAYYVLPYNWPWSLCMVLGSIMASTDPVAVSAVLKKACAPPRLQQHLSGESMLNDGSAMVFFTIFTQQFLYGIGVTTSDNTETMTVGSGFGIFFRMAFGGFAVGLLFGLILVGMLYQLDRRMEPQYNVLQVVAAISMAYLSYFVADQLWSMSGVTSCVTCGIVARALGKGMIRDEVLMDSYLALVEFLLNTLLFTLGGAVWGTVLGGNSSSETETGPAAAMITASDWGYLFIFYILIMVIRFIQIGTFYPLFSRIGLGSSLRESIFLGYGGIRGAVGIALAISFSSAVVSSTDDPDVRALAVTLEYISGGVALLTLFVNGTAAGLLLQKLKLTKPFVPRQRAVRLFEIAAENELLRVYKKLTRQYRFEGIRSDIIKKSVPLFNTALHDFEDDDNDDDVAVPNLDESQRRSPRRTMHERTMTDISCFSLLHECQDGNDDDEANACGLTRLGLSSSSLTCEKVLLQEIRNVFLELLDAAYTYEVRNGEIVVDSDQEYYFQGGMGLNDFPRARTISFTDLTSLTSSPPGGVTNQNELETNTDNNGAYSLWSQVKSWLSSKISRIDDSPNGSNGGGCICDSPGYNKIRNRVHHAIAFIGAHDAASCRLLKYGDINGCNDIADADVAIQKILEESSKEVATAKSLLDGLPEKLVCVIKSKYVCTILLYKLTKFIERNVDDEVITPKEAQLYLDKVKKSRRDQRRRRHHKRCCCCDTTTTTPNSLEFKAEEPNGNAVTKTVLDEENQVSSIIDDLDSKISVQV